MTHHNEQRELPLIQQAIIPIAAFAATGDQSKLTHALEQGLDAGMSVSTAKEVLVAAFFGKCFIFEAELNLLVTTPYSNIPAIFDWLALCVYLWRVADSVLLFVLVAVIVDNKGIEYA